MPYRASLYGTIKDDLGNVVPSALVQLSGGPGGTYTVHTDANGQYRIEDILPGMYDIVVRKADHDDFVTTRWPVEYYNTEFSVPEFRRLVTVNIHVVDESNNPINGAIVRLDSFGPSRIEGNRYIFEGVKQGQHTITASKDGYFTSTKAIDAKISSDNTWTIQLEESLTTLTGHTMDPLTNKPVSGAHVELLVADEGAYIPLTPRKSTTSNSSGRFTLNNVDATRSYKIVTTAPRYQVSEVLVQNIEAEQQVMMAHAPGKDIYAFGGSTLFHYDSDGNLKGTIDRVNHWTWVPFTISPDGYLYVVRTNPHGIAKHDANTLRQIWRVDTPRMPETVTLLTDGRILVPLRHTGGPGVPIQIYNPNETLIEEHLLRFPNFIDYYYGLYEIVVNNRNQLYLTLLDYEVEVINSGTNDTYRYDVSAELWLYDSNFDRRGHIFGEGWTYSGTSNSGSYYTHPPNFVVDPIANVMFSTSRSGVLVRRGLEGGPTKCIARPWSNGVLGAPFHIGNGRIMGIVTLTRDLYLLDANCNGTLIARNAFAGNSVPNTITAGIGEDVVYIGGDGIEKWTLDGERIWRINTPEVIKYMQISPSYSTWPELWE